MFKLLFICSFFFCTNVFSSEMVSVVNYLSSDILEGRKPGKDGNKLATNFLVSQFEKIGLSKINDSYKQNFTIFTDMTKSGENYCKLASSAIKFEFEPISYSLSGDLINAPIVFAGFGITVPKSDPNLSYDDYAELNVKDKIVIVFSGDPGIGNKKSIFRQPEYMNYRSIFYKLKNAIGHGAKGILIVSDPLSISNYPDEEDLYFNSSEGGGNRFSILAGKISNNSANILLNKLGKDTLKLQKKISKTQKPLSFKLNTSLDLSINLKKNTGRVSNILGRIAGKDPKLKKEVIVIGAHMDHLGWGGESSMDTSRTPKIHNGADDNASGTSLVVELASRIKTLGLKRSIVFVLFNAEEIGLLGSSYFVNNWGRSEKEYGKIVAMLNFDMVGRYASKLSIMAADSSLDLKTNLTVMSDKINYELKANSVGASDHASFLNKKIPALFFTTGAHEDYHRSSDTSEKINFSAMNVLADDAVSYITKISSIPNISFNPKYVTNSQGDRNRGYGAHLGCVPEFGQSDEIVGVLCVKASANSPASSAGIISGDILVKIGEIEIRNIYDLAFALKYYRSGDVVKISWKRGNTLFSQTVKLIKSRRG